MSAINAYPQAMPVYENTAHKVSVVLPELKPVPVVRIPVPKAPTVVGGVMAPATKCAFGMVPITVAVPTKHHLFTGSS